MVLTQSKASAHCTLLKGSTLFLHKNDRNLEHSKYLGFLLVLLFNAYLPHPAVSSMRTGRTVSFYPGLCLWHMLDKCSINAVWMDHPHLLHQSRQDQLFKTGEKAFSVCRLYPSLPLHNSFPSSSIHSKSTKKDTDQKVEPYVTNILV